MPTAQRVNRDQSIFIRMTTAELVALDVEIERRRREDPGATLSRSGVARSLLVGALSKKKKTAKR